MSGFLTRKYAEGEVLEIELLDWKAMIAKIKKMSEIKTDEQEYYMRKFVNDFLLWFIAVDARYNLAAADGTYFLLLLFFSGRKGVLIGRVGRCLGLD